MNYFIKEIDDAIYWSVLMAARGLKDSRKLEEPDYTAALTLFLPDELRHNFGPKIKFGGCFVHQKPIVHFEGQKKGCELGDLLVLCRKIIDKKERYNATLFQLKMAKVIVESPENKIQYRLYVEWPRFTIGPVFDINNCYDIGPKTVTPGAQYMYVVHQYDEYYHDSFCHSIPEAKMAVDPQFSFSRFLWDFIHWQNGKPFVPEKAKVKDEWSRLIWSIVDKTRDVVFNRCNIGQKDKIRQNGDFFQFITDSQYIRSQQSVYYDYLKTNPEGLKPNGDDPVIFNENEHGAMSILYIDMSNNGEENLQ